MQLNNSLTLRNEIFFVIKLKKKQNNKRKNKGEKRNVKRRKKSKKKVEEKKPENSMSFEIQVMTTRYYKYLQTIFSNQFDGFVNFENLFLFIWYLSQLIRLLQNIISDTIKVIRMKSTNKMLCLVNLPNGTTFGIQCDPKAIGQRCLEEVSTIYHLCYLCIDLFFICFGLFVPFCLDQSLISNWMKYS